MGHTVCHASYAITKKRRLTERNFEWNKIIGDLHKAIFVGDKDARVDYIQLCHLQPKYLVTHFDAH